MDRDTDLIGRRRTYIQHAEAGEDSYLACRGRWGHIQQAKIDGDMCPTGKHRTGHEPNRQRQMGTQQAEADGDLYPTGGDRWGHVLNR